MRLSRHVRVRSNLRTLVQGEYHANLTLTGTPELYTILEAIEWFSLPQLNFNMTNIPYKWLNDIHIVRVTWDMIARLTWNVPVV